MHFDAFDRYHETESFVHRLDPRIKVVVTVVFILSNALLPDGAWIAYSSGGRLYLADALGNQATEISDDGREPSWGR